MKRFLNDKKSVAVIAAAVVICLTVTGSALTVDGFTDYSPLDFINFHWFDYVLGNGTPTTFNESVGTPRWSAEYPYRALFMGAEKSGGGLTGQYPYILYCVYSRVPTTDLITFEPSYSTGDGGKIRASIPIANYGTTFGDSKEFIVVYAKFQKTDLMTYDNSVSGLTKISDFNMLNQYVDGQGIQGAKWYFTFDFFYDCASEHQQNAQDLRVNNVKNISGISYNHILNCTEHHGWTGGGSGGGGLSGDKNTSGNDGKHGWGSGDYGGGVNKDEIVSGNDGGEYVSRPDAELSVPDDWKTLPEDNYNSMPDKEYKPDYPEYVPAEGDTGETGENWALPEWSGDDGVSGELNGYQEWKSDGEQGLIDFMEPMEDWLK